MWGFWEALFLGEEVFFALSSLEGDKALGSDGFTMTFWHQCWDFVKLEVMGFFKGLFEQSSFVRRLNATFLVLILKNGGAQDLKDFKPINLIGGFYKLLAKVLANRLKGIVGKVVYDFSSCFCGGKTNFRRNPNCK